MKPTQEQVIAWAREAGFGNEVWSYADSFIRLSELAYEAGRKDERKRIADLIRSDRYGIGSMMSQWTNEDVAEDIEGEQ